MALEGEKKRWPATAVLSATTRRGALARLGRLLIAAVAVGAALADYGRRGRVLAATAIRPPGALPEPKFLAACVRCGLCVRDCPYDTLRLAEMGEPVPVGTPFFLARDIPCEMCEDIPCVKACPTGALDPALTDIKAADMGLAVFVGVDRCYSFNGIGACRACFIACPVKGEAITMELLVRDGRSVFLPTVHAEACTGCGKCEKDCITEEASIKVLPRRLAQTDTGLAGRYG